MDRGRRPGVRPLGTAEPTTSEAMPSRSRHGSVVASRPRCELPTRLLAGDGARSAGSSASRQPARGHRIVGRRDLLGDRPNARRPSSARRRPLEIEAGFDDFVRPTARLHSTTMTTRDLPMFEPPGADAATARLVPDTIAGGGLGLPAARHHAAPPSPGLDPRPHAVRRELPRPQGAAPRPRTSTRSARRPTARTSGSAGTSAPPRS